MDGPNCISSADPFERLDSASTPLIPDSRPAAAFDADIQLLVSLERAAPDHLAEWGWRVAAARQVVIFRVYDHEVSKGVANASAEGDRAL